MKMTLDRIDSSITAAIESALWWIRQADTDTERAERLEDLTEANRYAARAETFVKVYRVECGESNQHETEVKKLCDDIKTRILNA